MNRVTIRGDIRDQVERWTARNLRGQVRLRRIAIRGLHAGRRERFWRDAVHEGLDFHRLNLGLTPRKRRDFWSTEDVHAGVLLGGVKNRSRLRGGQDARPGV